MAASLAAALGLVVALAGRADWEPSVLGTLLAFAVVSDLWAVDIAANAGGGHGIAMSGSFVALVLAMVLLGAAPAALIGLLTIVIGHLRFHERHDFFLNNLVAYAWFPLAGGLVFDRARATLALGTDDAWLYGLVMASFAIALAVNFLVVMGYTCHLDGSSLREQARRALRPALQWDLAAAVLAAAMAYAYDRFGAATLAVLGVVLLSEQRLLGQVFAAEERAEQLRARIGELASLHHGLLETMIRTLDLRDRMTARHSAAVAHYAREIAAAIGMTEDEQALVHTAGLLHDIGKFNLPDPILKADVPLGEEDWDLIRRHPEEGARLVSYLDGYEGTAELIRAHHERYDGCGYPAGLAGRDIPLGARIISVADTYDVMTARDSYSTPVSSHAAIAELRRVAGAQLDPAVVSVFVELLATRELGYRHAEDADFDAALGVTPLPVPARA
jgi:putative nucleotidyltransferase with HDIG domain